MAGTNNKKEFAFPCVSLNLWSATLARILGSTHAEAAFSFAPSGQRRRAVRRKIERLRDFAPTR